MAASKLPEAVALLRGHGVGPGAARRAVQIGEQLRQRTEEIGHEFAALLDAADGSLVGSILEGSHAEVDLSSHLRAAHPGRRHVQIHTHPANTSFSIQDLLVLLTHPEVRTMVAVGRDATWHVVTKERGQPTASIEEALIVWSEALDATDARFDGLIASGVLTELEAHRQQLHEVMQAIAPHLHLRYDRLEG